MPGMDTRSSLETIRIVIELRFSQRQGVCLLERSVHFNCYGLSSGRNQNMFGWPALLRISQEKRKPNRILIGSLENPYAIQH